MRRYGFSGISIVLVSTAQLLMKWGMSTMPTLQGIMSAPASLWPFLAIGSGIVMYLLSLLTWMVSLKYLPLSHAYPLLSMSYALVYLATICLPWYDETLSVKKMLGIMLIICGIVLISKKRKSGQTREPT